MASGLNTALANKPQKQVVDDHAPSADHIKTKVDRHAILLRDAPPRFLIGAMTLEMVRPDDFNQFRIVGGKTLATIGVGAPPVHVCLRAPGGAYVTLSGRLSNTLYVPGVEDVVVFGERVVNEVCPHLPAAE